MEIFQKMSAEHNVTIGEEFNGLLVDDADTLHKIMDTFQLEVNEGFEIPDWLTPELEQKLRWLDSEWFNTQCATKRLNQINAGPVFYDIANKIRQLVKTKNNDSSGYDFTTVNVGAGANKKLTFYSATDIVMSNLLVGLRAFDPIHHLSPPPAATVSKLFQSF